MKGKPYGTFALAITVHFLVMWALTYVGVAAFDHVFLNLNRFYMAVVVAPMAWCCSPRRGTCSRTAA